jgi:hypothetical protein
MTRRTLQRIVTKPPKSHACTALPGWSRRWHAEPFRGIRMLVALGLGYKQ